MADNKKTRNPDSPLYRRLTRLFSGPIINYRTQTQRRFKRQQLDKFKFTSTSGLQFKKSEYNPFETIGSDYMHSQNRNERYVDFDQMEFMPEIASALDIYADEMTTSSDLKPLLKIDCPNQEIKSVLDVLYHNILNVDFNLFGWCRTMCKFGDFFLYLDIDDDIGVKNVIGLPSAEIERLEGQDQQNANYIQYQWNSGGLTFENWQIAHFRILGNDKYSPYGTSILEPARRIWRQLVLIEDAMMAYRIVRSPERRVFYIDVGSIAPQDVEQYMQKVMVQMKRNQVIDPDTGRVDLRYNPMSIDEDFYIPMRGGESGTKIQTLPGGTYTGDIDDVKYLRDKLFSALKVPQSYLASTEGESEDKTTLAQKDIRFARTIQRLQRSIVAELEKVGIIHLYTLGFRGDDLVKFNLSLNNPSKIAELQELEHWRTKFDVASNATDGFFSHQWVYKNVFGMSDEEIVHEEREMFHDRKLESLYNAIAEGGTEAGFGGAGGIVGEEEPEEGFDIGEPEAGEAPEAAEAEAPAEEEGGLIIPAPEEAPAKRDDGSYTKPGWKGKMYKEVDDDKRDMGARKRHFHSQWSNETGKNTPRNVFKGFSDLKTMSKGVYNENQTNYDLEERKLFEMNHNIQNLVESLEEKRKDND